MIKPDKDNIVISKKPHGTCLASRGYYIPVTIMYTNNTLDIGLMWERQDRNNTKNAAGLATFLFGWEGRRRREAKAKHEKRGHFGRIFRARNGMGIGQVPKHKKCGPTGRIFRVWMRVRGEGGK